MVSSKIRSPLVATIPVFAILLLGPIINQSAMSEPSAANSARTNSTTKDSTASQNTAIPSDDELRKKLTPLQYAVTRENATERPFTNEYWKHNAEGIYVDIITGKPLFSSKDKFDTDCGWPGFAKPIDAAEIKELNDKSHGMERIEVRSKSANSHLGHVFNDGPKELGGLRYCINSAAIRFVPKEKMAEAGYGAWLKIFETKQTATTQQNSSAGDKAKTAR